MDIRRIIADAMLRRGISQRRLSEMTGITQPRISNYLTGRRDVQGETLNKIFDVLGLELREKKER